MYEFLSTSRDKSLDMDVMGAPTHMASFGMMVWDRLMCYEENSDMRVKFLSLTMQHADAFGYLISVLAEAKLELKEYRCGEGHLLDRTVLSPYCSFPLPIWPKMSSEARKKLSEPGVCGREHRKDETGSKFAKNREKYKRRKVTSAYKL